MLENISLITLLNVIIAIPICCHILLKKESQSVAIGWIALVLLSPFVGALLYWLFGINRIASYARSYRETPPSAGPELQIHEPPAGLTATDHERQIFQFAKSVHNYAFLPGNNVDLLVNGDEAYPAMLASITNATTSVALSVYIFDYDPVGKQFMDALIAAHRRGVTVRVLIDDVGVLYSKRAIDRELAKDGVMSARFVPRRAKFLPFLNLRNHRKILVVDGREAFVGGMNLREGHVLGSHPRHPVQDIHFRVIGPVIDQINMVFEQDWRFAAGTVISLPNWWSQRAEPSSAGVLARFVPDGPDDNFEKLQWILLGALALSRTRVRIMTPYFLPNDILASALMVAALRGVVVEVIVPARSNLPFMTWAMTAVFERLIAHGVKIYTSPPPFDHGKLVVVDGVWSLVGSSNWDQRSLRLNFEANLECYHPGIGAELDNYFLMRKSSASLLDVRDLRAASIPARLRNRLVGLLSPYL